LFLGDFDVNLTHMAGAMNMPLTIELIPDEEQGGFTARVPDIPAYGEGNTEDEAIADLEEALRGYIETFGLDDALARMISTPLSPSPVGFSKPGSWLASR
jgi:predicted RNase H-like HicB family nuclease